MIFTELAVAGAFAIVLQPHIDERGYFVRAWDAEELTTRGLTGAMCQANVGFSPIAGTFRGLHLQRSPHAEAKLVRCTRGRAFDVIVDLRVGSPTRGEWAGIEIDPRGLTTVYVPEGVAHGYLTLEPDTEVMYLTSHPYVPEAAHGVRHDDPAFGIQLPVPVAVISEADRSWPAVAL